MINAPVYCRQMPLFDRIKDPERVAAPVVSFPEETLPEMEVELSELELLRASAREVDARSEVAPEFAMDDLAESFCAMCLAKARQSSQEPYKDDPEIVKYFDPRRTLRVVAVSVLTGDWPTVLSGREAALATVAELQRRGYGAPAHDYLRVADVWELRVRFSF